MRALLALWDRLSLYLPIALMGCWRWVPIGWSRAHPCSANRWSRARPGTSRTTS
jgi:hypothetical protein